MMENAWECHIFRASTTWTPGKAGSSGILRPGLVHLEPLHGQFVSGRENLWKSDDYEDEDEDDSCSCSCSSVSSCSCSCSSSFCSYLYVLINCWNHEISWDITIILWMSCSSIHSWYRWLLELRKVILRAAAGEFHGATLLRYVWLRWALLGFLLAEGAELRTWGKMEQCRGNVVWRWLKVVAELTVACWDLNSCPTDRPCHGKTMLLGVHLPLSPQKLLGIGQSSTRKWVAYG